MTGLDLKEARTKLGWTQEQAAGALGLTQAYLSMVELERRSVSPRVLQRARDVFDLPPAGLPLDAETCHPIDADVFKSELGALGYPGFNYLRGKPTKNPALLLFEALGQAELDTRVVEALPWLASKYELRWDWLVPQAKKCDLQNRLGFVVTVAKDLAARHHESSRANKLAEAQLTLERGRLAREDTLCHESMTNAERRWLQQNRSDQARHWNLLTDLELDNLPYAAA
jgi:transcriptional regulator with XRE-family HTH domain